jgi:hypothetical protein
MYKKAQDCTPVVCPLSVLGFDQACTLGVGEFVDIVFELA